MYKGSENDHTSAARSATVYVLSLLQFCLVGVLLRITTKAQQPFKYLARQLLHLSTRHVQLRMEVRSGGAIGPTKNVETLTREGI
jgi:hypothetical protein